MDYHIKSFLDKFFNLKNKNVFLKECLIESIFINTNIKIKPEQIEINKKSITVSAPSAVKNEIFLKKQIILDNFLNKTKDNISEINWR